MAGVLSTAVVDALLDAYFGATPVTAPATVYIGLSTTPPLDTGSGTTAPSGGAYARVAVTNNTTNWPAASARLKANGTVVTFPAATAAWGTITHYTLHDAATAGTFLGWGALASSQTVGTGGVASFAVGALTITAPGS